MPYTNMWFLDFIEGNLLLITFFLGLLKTIAMQTKWAGDDKIVTFLFEFVKNPLAKKSEAKDAETE